MNEHKELKKSLSNTSKKQLLFYVKYRKTNIFGCSSIKKIKLKATNDLFEVFTYEEKENKNEKSEIICERIFLKIKADNIVTISIYQNTITDKNSFVIAYYEKDKTDVKCIRFSCDNRFECERYYLKLKDLYGKSADYFCDAFKFQNSGENADSNLIKDKLFSNPKNIYYSLRIIEEILSKRSQYYKDYFIKTLSNKETVKDNL